MLESLPITAAHRFAFSALFAALLSSPISLVARVGPDDGHFLSLRLSSLFSLSLVKTNIWFLC